MMRDKKLIKSAGEHWVCAALSQLGWVVALTRDGVERTDILAVNENGRHLSVQVKTTSSADNPKFMLGAKGINIALGTNEWYVLVALPNEVSISPRAFIVPRDHVAAATWIRHQEWFTNPKVKPGSRTTGLSANRIDSWLFSRYENRWDLLEEPSNLAPIMLPVRCKELITNPRVGLPPDHPWKNEVPHWDTSESSDAWPSWWATSSD